MAKILIVYHSQTGKTQKDGACRCRWSEVYRWSRSNLKKAGDCHTGRLLTADGLALGTPENFGYMSGMVKDFFDRTFYGAQEKVFRKPFCFSSAPVMMEQARSEQSSALLWAINLKLFVIRLSPRAPLRKKSSINALSWAEQLPAAARWASINFFPSTIESKRKKLKNSIVMKIFILRSDNAVEKLS